MSGDMNGDLDTGRKIGALTFAAGVAVGIIITLIILSLTTGSSGRYALHSSQDGSVVHKIDTDTGRVWWKNSYVEIDPQGQPVTIWYWEELTLDRPGAAKLASDVKSSTDETIEAEEQMRLAEEKERNEIKEKRLGEIYNICGDDAACVKKKCAVGYKGADDPNWTAHCTERVKAHISDVIIEQCGGDADCIKSYCINKYNNTYPAVSDCVSEINLQKVKSESLKSPEGAEAEQAE
ncbi:MAG: hypothetical protein L0213_00015 [Candidatus Dadabacteria bacterium]|nr:hypothetical protein [Candidatus Dadabacteria bacterium]